MTDPGAELDDFVAVSVSLAFGSLGPGPQVGAQLVTVAGGVSAEAGQHLVRVDADPAGLSPGSVLGRLRASGILLGQGLLARSCQRLRSLGQRYGSCAQRVVIPHAAPMLAAARSRSPLRARSCW